MIEEGEKFVVRKVGNTPRIERLTMVPTTSTVKWKTPSELFRILMAELRNAHVLEHFLKCLSRSYRIPLDTDISLRLRLTEAVLDEIDYRWDMRITSLVYRSLSVEWLLWSLSTLGGAVSAMADYVSSFVEKARIVSFKQLRLANYIGDPVLISRCKLYIAMSLAQRGKKKTAMQIVRQEYKKAKNLESDFLCHCCEGVWAKLKALELHGCNKPTAGNGYNIYSKNHYNSIIK